MELKTLARFKLSFGAPTKRDDAVVFEQVAIVPNLLLFCAASNVGSIYLGDIARDKITALCRLSSPVSALSMMQKASEVIVALVFSTDGSFSVVDTGSGVVVGFHAGDGDISNYISIHPSSDRVITTGGQSIAVIWNVEDDRLVPLQRLNITDKVNLHRAQFSFDGNSIITWIADGRIIIWDFPSLQFLRQLPTLSTSDADRFEFPLVSTAYSRDGQFMAAVGGLAKLILWNTTSDTGPMLVDLSDEFSNSMTMEFVSNCRDPTIVFLGSDGLLRLYEPLNKDKIKVVRSSKADRRYVRLVVQREANRCLMAAVGVDGSLDLLSAIPAKKGLKRRQVSEPAPLDEKKPVSSARPPSSPKRDVDPQKEVVVSTDSLNIETLEGILRDFGAFPAKHRSTIWNHVLKLPRNREAYQTIVNRGPHPVFEKLEETFDVIDKNLLQALKRTLSAVCHWCSLFAQVTYLPLLVFPFVKVFRNDPLTCFEIIVTCLSNLCHAWFEYYPAPPLQVLADVDLLLADACPALLDHFKAKQVSAQIYAWPLLRSALSEVFTEDEWLVVWDQVVLYRDQMTFLPAIVAAYAVVSQNSLLLCQREEDFQRYFRDKNPIPVKALLEKARQLVDGKVKLHDCRRLFTPLPSGTYPVFYNFPRAAIEHHAREQINLRNLAIDYENQKKATDEAEAIHGTVLQLEQEMKRRDAIERAAEIMRKRHIFEEEQRLANERCRLRRMTGELRKRELIALEANQRRLNREKQLQENGHVGEDEISRFAAATRMAERRDAADNASARHHLLLKDGYRQEAAATKYSLALKEATRRLAQAVFKNANEENS